MTEQEFFNRVDKAGIQFDPDPNDPDLVTFWQGSRQIVVRLPPPGKDLRARLDILLDFFK